jgi:2-polyprenyl-6-methoxyphenol hydroxylase-like FAD-dependent oxidoreductase
LKDENMTRKPPRIVIVGAGVAGSLVASGLAGRDDVEVICLEKVDSAGQADAGTGLNIGPNAIKSLTSVMPERAKTIVANSLPWKRWTVSCTDGRQLMDLPLGAVADNLGVRIRWSELYVLLRAPIAGNIVYEAELRACGHDRERLFVRYSDARADGEQTLGDIDLLIAGDGRYSRIREHFCGKEEPEFLGVCLYRILFPAEPDCPIDDYSQWFNGPNRLLAFRTPGNLVYCAGSFPIPADGIIPDGMKSPEALRRCYTPSERPASRECALLIEAIVRHADHIHWARLQEGSVRYAAGPGVLLVGDAAHPMAPTLGQGATQAVEDACVVVDEVRKARRRGDGLESISERVDARRRARAQFVADFSREATDTMLAGADPIAGTLAKLEAPFQERLARLYRDAPVATT